MKEDGIKAAGAGCQFPICLTCTFTSLAPSVAFLHFQIIIAPRSCTNASTRASQAQVLEIGCTYTCTNASVLNLASWLATSKLHLIIHDDDGGGGEEFTKYMTEM